LLRIWPPIRCGLGNFSLIEELAQITFTRLDVTDRKAVVGMVADYGVTHIIHLAGLQVPFCRANPSVGAAVNVLGTVNIFEAAREHWGQVQGLAYASSLAVLGPSHLYETPVVDDVPIAFRRRSTASTRRPTKRRRASTGRIGRSPALGCAPTLSMALARDQGMTSDIAKAILATVAGRPITLSLGDR
jgi:hypothetical protein